MTDRQTCGAQGGMEAGHLNAELLEDSEEGEKDDHTAHEATEKILQRHFDALKATKLFSGRT